MKHRCLLCMAAIAALGLSAQNVPPFPVNPVQKTVRKADSKAVDSGLNLPKQTGKWQKGPNGKWFVHFDEALEQARKQKKCLYLLSTGSDWCGYCIKLHDDVLKKSKFKSFANKNLILVYLDSPRKKPLPTEQEQHNQAVKRAFFGNSGGVPHAVILSPTGQCLGTLMGYRSEDAYMAELEKIIPDKLNLPKNVDSMNIQDEFKRSQEPGYASQTQRKPARKHPQKKQNAAD